MNDKRQHWQESRPQGARMADDDSVQSRVQDPGRGRPNAKKAAKSYPKGGGYNRKHAGARFDDDQDNGDDDRYHPRG
jgi:hypothetical protein